MDEKYVLIDRTGEFNEISQAKIYRSAGDIDVEFQDTKTIVKHKMYRDFKNNKIKDPMKMVLERTGQEKVNKYGETMKIITYRESEDIDVCINGEILEHKNYRHFKNGELHSSKINPFIINRIGEKYDFNDGSWMEIIEYFSRRNITVRFSDGTEVKKCYYGNFSRGAISNPNKMVKLRVGETRINKDGLEMEIIAYRGNKDIDVMFLCDGSVVEHVQYQQFSSGILAHPSSVNNKNRRELRIGEERINNQGLTLRITDYRNSSDVDVFVVETNETIVGRNYQGFISGAIHSQKFALSQKINQSVMMNNGLFAKIINYRKYDDVDYEFEDGLIAENRSARCLQSGALEHLNLSVIYKKIFHGFETLYAWKDEDAVYYKARCLNCMTESVILTPQQMLAHKCYIPDT